MLCRTATLSRGPRRSSDNCTMQTCTSAVLDEAPGIESLYADLPRRRTSGGIEYIDLSDEFINWLSFANAGMLNRGNLLCFDYALANLPSEAPLVEIGSFCGLSTNLLGYFKRRHNVDNPLFTSDRWQFEGADPGGMVGDSAITHSSYRQFVKESFLRNVRMFSATDLPHTIEMLSDDFFAAWSRGQTAADVFDRPVILGGPISFCYIDGDHRYAPARRDFLNADRHLQPGGFILFDDSADGSHWEVCRVIEEIKRLPNYRVVIKNPNYLVQKIA